MTDALEKARIGMIAHFTPEAVDATLLLFNAILDAREEKAEPAGDNDAPRRVDSLTDARAETTNLAMNLDDALARIEALEQERDKTRSILAGVEIGSLPNDMSCCRVAEARMDDIRVLQGQRDEYLADIIRMRKEADWLIKCNGRASVRAEKAEAALAERDARIEELERERDEAVEKAADQGRKALALFDEAKRAQRAERKAEAALAGLRGRVETALEIVGGLLETAGDAAITVVPDSVVIGYAERIVALLSPRRRGKGGGSAGRVSGGELPARAPTRR